MATQKQTTVKEFRGKALAAWELSIAQGFGKRIPLRAGVEAKLIRKGVKDAGMLMHYVRRTINERGVFHMEMDRATDTVIVTRVAAKKAKSKKAKASASTAKPKTTAKKSEPAKKTTTKAAELDDNAVLDAA